MNFVQSVQHNWTDISALFISAANYRPLGVVNRPMPDWRVAIWDQTLCSSSQWKKATLPRYRISLDFGMWGPRIFRPSAA